MEVRTHQLHVDIVRVKIDASLTNVLAVSIRLPRPGIIPTIFFSMYAQYLLEMSMHGDGGIEYVSSEVELTREYPT